MSLLDQIRNRAGYLSRRQEFDQELDEEIRFHIESRAEELIEQGVPAQRARQQAHREFGSRTRMREESREAWTFQWLEDLWRDFVYSVRTSRKHPVFTISAVLSLAMGVGANCGVFMFVDGFLLRPLPVPNSNEVVTIYATMPQNATAPLAYPDYVDLRERSHSFSGIVAFAEVSAGFARQPREAGNSKDGQMVSGNYFDVLEVKPALGRFFLPQEDQEPGRDAVVVLSHHCWEKDFLSDPDIAGKQVWLSGNAFTIVGVAPASFLAVDDDLMEDYPEYYVPLMMAPRLGSTPGLLQDRKVRSLSVLARLPSGVAYKTAVKQAQAEVSAIASSLERQYPATHRKRGLFVQEIRRYRSSGALGMLGAVLMTLAGAVLLAACANVGGLLSSRSAERSKEIAMRLAIGARRSRLIRQLLTESLVLAMVAGAAGITLCYVLVAVMKRMAAVLLADQPMDQLPFRVDQRLLLFAVGISLLSVILFGLLPAFQTTRVGLTMVIKGSSIPRRRWKFFRELWGRNLLVTSQVAISVLLLTCATVGYAWLNSGLAGAREAGFASEHVMTVTLDAMAARYSEPRLQQFYSALLDRVRAVPGAKATMGGAATRIAAWPEGYQPADMTDEGPGGGAFGVWVDNRFFDQLSIPILQGRGLSESDKSGAPEVAVVGERLAGLVWPGQNPIGKRMRVREADVSRWVEVVGVSAIENYENIIEVPPPRLIFFPAAQHQGPLPMTLYAETPGDRASLIDSIRSIVHQLDSNQAVPKFVRWRENEKVFDRGLQFIAQIFTTLGGMGLFLSLVGLYGLIAYDVSRRTREIGIRVALGARRSAVLRMILRKGLVLTVCGIVVGVFLSLGLGKVLLASIGTGGSPKDGAPFTFSEPSAAAFLVSVLVVTMLAAYIPARRASKVDPNVALKYE